MQEREEHKQEWKLEYTSIPKAFFTPHHVGRSCIHVIPVHCCVPFHSCTNVSPNICCATMSSNNYLRSFLPQFESRSHFAQKWVPTMEVVLSHCSQQWVPTTPILGAHFCTCSWTPLLPNNGLQQWSWIMRPDRQKNRQSVMSSP
jgi:hypothetical protein